MDYQKSWNDTEYVSAILERRMSVESRQIASKAADQARERLETRSERRSDFMDGLELDEPVLTPDELEEIAQQAAKEVRSSKAAKEEPKRLPPAPAAAGVNWKEEQQRSRWESTFRDYLRALRNLNGKHFIKWLRIELDREAAEVFSHVHAS